MLASAIVTRARIMLADNVVPYSWADAYLLWNVNDAVDATIERRPDLVMDDNEVQRTLTDVGNLTHAIDLPDGVTSALAHYVAYRALAEDESDKLNADAAERHYEAFLREIYGS